VSGSAFPVLLARHPQIEGAAGICYGRRDLSLAPGWQQTASGWSTLVTGLQIGLVLTSPSRRCRLPAQWLASRIDARMIVDERLMELDFGAWEGMPWDKIDRTALDRWAADPEAFVPPGGEAVAALQSRIAALWRDIKSARQPVCVVTHGGPLRFLTALAEGRAENSLDQSPEMGAARLFRVTTP